jgi:hypothetical protein
MATCLALGLVLMGQSLSRADEPNRGYTGFQQRSPQQWIDDLKSDDPLVREMAASALGRLGSMARMLFPT